VANDCADDARRTYTGVHGMIENWDGGAR